MQNNIDNIKLGFVNKGTKDNNNLTDEFNYRLRKLYTSLLMFYDEETARNIFEEYDINGFKINNVVLNYGLYKTNNVIYFRYCIRA